MQRWSPGGHGLGLEAPRGQLVMSLALALGAKSLALALKAKSLALASENMYLLLIIFALCA